VKLGATWGKRERTVIAREEKKYRRKWVGNKVGEKVTGANEVGMLGGA